jgi:polyisoprenyl-phosphate glycosyltransferase
MSIGPSESAALSADSIVILIPIFNDWNSLSALLSELEQVLAKHELSAQIVVVDDGSTSPRPEGDLQHGWQALRGIDVLELRRNLGHQRAIAIGLAYVEDRDTCRAVVVMDGDGEDDPRDVPLLLETCRDCGWQKIVFAERTKRSESISFRAFYSIYKVMYRLLTGRAIHFGNFSVVPRHRLSSLISVSEMWNHYAAAVLKSRQPYCAVPTERTKRLQGQSKMNFVAYVIHGLSAISVDSELVGVRLLLLSFGMVLVALIGLAVTVGIRFGTNLAVPDWAMPVVGVITFLLFQTVVLTVIFSFITLGGRHNTFFLPKRDYVHYVRRSYSLWQRS